jgi:hypothetical protein
VWRSGPYLIAFIDYTDMGQTLNGTLSLFWQMIWVTEPPRCFVESIRKGQIVRKEKKSIAYLASCSWPGRQTKLSDAPAHPALS